MAKLSEEIVVKVRTDVDVGYDAIHLLTWIRNMSIRWPKGTASERLKIVHGRLTATECHIEYADFFQFVNRCLELFKR